MRSIVFAFAAGVLTLGLSLVSGCGRGETMMPVSGRITVAKKPLSTGHVGFIPDEAAGNTSLKQSIGELKENGQYTLATLGADGVRPGKYKVVVWASDGPLPEKPYGPDGQMIPIKWLVASKYTNKDTTDLRVEVVENPAAGAYDFDLSPP